MDNIYLQDILPLDKLKIDGKVLLLRHFHENLEEMNKKKLIEEYQSFQSKPAFIDCKYVVSFLSSERKAVITGLAPAAMPQVAIPTIILEPDLLDLKLISSIVFFLISANSAMDFI